MIQRAMKEIKEEITIPETKDKDTIVREEV